MEVHVDPPSPSQPSEKSSEQNDEDEAYSSIQDDKSEVDDIDLKVELDLNKKNETANTFTPIVVMADGNSSISSNNKQITSRSVLD